MRPQRPLKLRMRSQHPFGGRGCSYRSVGGEGGLDAPPASTDVPASFGGRSSQVGGGVGQGGRGVGCRRNPLKSSFHPFSSSVALQFFS
jgi:hypothetical protein